MTLDRVTICCNILSKMPRHRAVPRLEDLCLSTVAQTCSLACTRLEEEQDISGTSQEEQSTTPDIAPVSSHNQVCI